MEIIKKRLRMDYKRLQALGIRRQNNGFRLLVACSLLPFKDE